MTTGRLITEASVRSIAEAIRELQRRVRSVEAINNPNVGAPYFTALLTGYEAAGNVFLYSWVEAAFGTSTGWVQRPEGLTSAGDGEGGPFDLPARNECEAANTATIRGGVYVGSSSYPSGYFAQPIIGKVLPPTWPDPGTTYSWDPDDGVPVRIYRLPDIDEYGRTILWFNKPVIHDGECDSAQVAPSEVKAGASVSGGPGFFFDANSAT